MCWHLTKSGVRSCCPNTSISCPALSVATESSAEAGSSIRTTSGGIATAAPCAGAAADRPITGELRRSLISSLRRPIAARDAPDRRSYRLLSRSAKDPRQGCRGSPRPTPRQEGAAPMQCRLAQWRRRISVVLKPCLRGSNPSPLARKATRAITRGDKSHQNESKRRPSSERDDLPGRGSRAASLTARRARCSRSANITSQTPPKRTTSAARRSRVIVSAMSNIKVRLALVGTHLRSAPPAQRIAARQRQPGHPRLPGSPWCTY